MDAAHSSHAFGHSVSVEEHNYRLKFAWWLYIASEVMLFATLIGVFIIAKRLYPEQGELLNIPLTSVGTFVLLMSSWTIVRSLDSILQGDQVALARGLFLTMLFGTFFVGMQVYEYTHLSHEGLTLHSSMYGSAFYLLTGFHGFHVFGGVVWIAWAFRKAMNGHFTKENYIGIELLGLYWHFVDVVWIILFTLIYLM